MKTAERTNDCPEVLLPELLCGRNPLERFKHHDKQILAEALHYSWLNNPDWHPTEALAVHYSQLAQHGYYIDGELSVLLDSQLEQELQHAQNNALYLTTNVETPDELICVRAVLRELGNPSTTLVTMYTPLQRGDRPEMRANGKREVVLLKQYLCDLKNSGVDRMIVCDSHSPAFSYFALECGIRVLDLSVLPMLFNAAREHNLLADSSLCAVSGDDGATEMGKLVEDLSRSQGFPCIGHLEGSKVRTMGKTSIEFPRERLALMKGKIALIAEDIISTGGTLNNVIDKLLLAGAARVVVLVTYPIFAGHALETLGNKENVFIITTDGRTPQHDIHAAQNIIQLPVKNSLSQLVELEQDGLNLWTPEGVHELGARGFCIAPWQTYHTREE